MQRRISIAAAFSCLAQSGVSAILWQPVIGQAKHMTQNISPPVAFHFQLTMEGDPAVYSFQDISGIETTTETERLEGAENRFVRNLPNANAHQNLKLKRGVVSGGSPLLIWCKSILEQDFGKPIESKTLDVALLNVAGNAVRTWQFTQSYPVRWQVDMMTTQSDIAVQEIEIAFTQMRQLD